MLSQQFALYFPFAAVVVATSLRRCGAALQDPPQSVAAFNVDPSDGGGTQQRLGVARVWVSAGYEWSVAQDVFAALHTPSGEALCSCEHGFAPTQATDLTGA